MRMVLNAMLVPTTRPAACGFDVAPHVTLSKIGPATVAPSGSMTYTINLGNSGTSATGTTLVIADQLPAGVSATAVTAGTNVAAVDCGTMPSATGALLACTVTLTAPMAVSSPNGTSKFTITATAPASGSITNYASAAPLGTGTPPTPGPACVTDNCGNAPTTITEATSPNVTLVKLAPATVLTGASCNYTIALGNNGSATTGTTINVKDLLPTGVIATAVSNGTNVSGLSCGSLPVTGDGFATLDCVVTLGTGMVAGAINGTSTFTITATAPAGTGDITNYAAASPPGDGTPPTPGPNCTPADSCGNVATSITEPPPPVTQIPTLRDAMLAALMLLLAGAGMYAARRARSARRS